MKSMNTMHLPKIWTCLFLLLYPCIRVHAAKPVQPVGDRITQLELQLDRDPEQVLEEVRNLAGDIDPSGQPQLVREAQLLEINALIRLRRQEEAHNLVKPLWETVSREAGTPQLTISRFALAMAECLSLMSRSADAEIFLQLALRQIPEGMDPPHKGRILMILARCQVRLGEPMNCAETATRCIQWANEHNQPRIALEARFLMAYAYRELPDLKLARRYFQQTVEQARKLGSSQFEIVSLNELGNVLALEEDFPGALALKRQALEKARAANDSYLESIVTHDIGYTHSLAGDYEQAISLFRQYLSQQQKQDSLYGVIVAQLNMANCYGQLGDITQAMELAESARKLTRENNVAEAQETVLAQMIELMRIQSRFAEALDFQQELTDLQQQRFQRELNRQVTELEDRHKLMEQESEIKILRQEQAIRDLQIDRQRFTIGAAIAVAILLALIAIFAIRGYRVKQQANRQLSQMNDQLDELARTDPLTGLSNRRDMMEKLRLFVARADRSGSPITILMADLDNFKQVNDTHGHDTGDLVLKETARALREQVRAQDLIGRWGGEEFLIALTDTDLDGARIAAEKFRLAVELGGAPEDSVVETVTVTIGLSVYTPERELEAVIQEADNRLYQGKEAGRNRVIG